MVSAVGALVFICGRWRRAELLLAYVGLVLVVLTFWEIRDLEIGAHTHDTYAVFLDDYLPRSNPPIQDSEYCSRLKTYENVRWLAENNQYLANSRNRPTFPVLWPFVVLSSENREGIFFVNSYKDELQSQMQARFENFKADQLNKLASLPNDDTRIDSMYKLAALGLYLEKYKSRDAALADLDKSVSDPALRKRFDSRRVP